jgi:hypothetical protein
MPSEEKSFTKLAVTRSTSRYTLVKGHYRRKGMILKKDAREAE